MTRLFFKRNIAVAAFVMAAVAGCQSDHRHAATSGAGTATGSVSPAAAADASSTTGSPLLLWNIERRGEGSYNIDDVVLVHLAVDALAGKISVVRSQRGYRLGTVPTNSLLARLGLMTGDQLNSLNGVPLNGPESLKKAYEVGRDWQRLRLVGQRAGQLLRIEYRVTSLRQRPRTSSRALAAAIDALSRGVKRLGDDQYEIDRAVIDALSEHSWLLRHRRHLASTSGDPGVRLSFLDITGYRALGLHAGDIVHEANQQCVSDPEQLYRVWSTLNDADQFTISLTREGTKRHLHYLVVTGLVDRDELNRQLARLSSSPSAAKRRPHNSRDPELPSAVSKVGESVYEIDRKKVAPHLDLDSLSRAARYLPEVQAGHIVGYRLFGIRYGSVLRVLGFRNGDRVTRINGYPLDSAEKATELYQKLRNAPRITVQLARRGRSKTLIYSWQ